MGTVSVFKIERGFIMRFSNEQTRNLNLRIIRSTAREMEGNVRVSASLTKMQVLNKSAVYDALKSIPVFRIMEWGDRL